MSLRTILVVFLALFCGAAMAVGVLRSNQPREVRAQPVMETEPVLVALVDLDRGRMVTEEQVEIREWPEGFAPDSTLRTVECAVERVVVGNVRAGELILEGKLASPEAGRQVAALIPEGKRAYTMMATRVPSNVAGFVLPGNRVDVLLNMRGGRGDDTGGGSTVTLLQAVEVLAVDQQLEAPVDNKVDPKLLSSVTVLVTPEQANELDLGQNMGVLSLALRNPSDLVLDEINEATVAGLRLRGPSSIPYLDGDLPPPSMFAALEEQTGDPPPGSHRRASIVTMRGTQRGEIQLNEGTPVP